MVRLDLAYFYRLSVAFHSLRFAPVGKMEVAWPTLYSAEAALQSLMPDPHFGSTLRRAAIPGRALLTELTALANRDWETEYSAYDRTMLLRQLDQFEAVLQSELAVADAYFVVQKPSLDTGSLIYRGEDLFPAALAQKVPEAVEDLREAGRCLAFELFTAAAFHVVRTVETVLRSYWTAITGNTPKPKQRNIGAYMRGLRALDCGDEKVMRSLETLRDLHRNVLIHTEEKLTLDRAVSFIGMARTVVDAMLEAIPEPVVAQEIEPSSEEAFPALAAAADAAATMD